MNKKETKRDTKKEALRGKYFEEERERCFYIYKFIETEIYKEREKERETKTEREMYLYLIYT